MWVQDPSKRLHSSDEGEVSGPESIESYAEVHRPCQFAIAFPLPCNGVPYDQERGQLTHHICRRRLEKPKCPHHHREERELVSCHLQVWYAISMCSYWPEVEIRPGCDG